MEDGDTIEPADIPSPTTSHPTDRPNFTSSEEDEAEGPGGAAKQKKRKKRKTGKEQDAKIGHRKVDKETGEVQYKKVKSSILMQSIQMGIRQSIGALSQRQHRDLLMQDFSEIIRAEYPKEGSVITPPHHFDDFAFLDYAPKAFRHFRSAFNIDTADFLISLCDKPLRELSNPGASGSVFYLSHDDAFIIKTVQSNECDFLLKLLPGYYLNVVQNKRTLLPKFFGLYCYQTSLGRKIRLVIMNNLLPSRLAYYERFDLKGSTFGRLASENELRKKSPTLKDLDFLERHKSGIRLPLETYEKLAMTLRRDCLVLQSFKIMDFSLLVGLHNGPQDVVKEDTQPPELSPPRAAASSGQFLSPPTSPDSDVRFRGPKPATVVVAGYKGYASYVNGTFEQTGDIVGGKDLYRLREGIPHGHGKMSGTELYIVFNKPLDRWDVSTTSTDPPTQCLAWIKASHPVSSAENVWTVLDLQGAATLLPSMSSVLTEPLPSASRPRRMSYSRPSESIDSDADDRPKTPDVGDDGLGGLVGYNEQNEKVVIFCGVIDILQSYGVRKKLEHTFKAMLHDGDTISVHRPKFYVKRFTDFMLRRVFVPCDEKGNTLEVSVDGAVPRTFGASVPITRNSHRRQRERDRANGDRRSKIASQQQQDEAPAQMVSLDISTLSIESQPQQSQLQPSSEVAVASSKSPRSILVEAASSSADPNHVHFQISESPSPAAPLNGSQSTLALTVNVVDDDGSGDDDDDVTHEVEV